jgi:import receptor subunit TOM70
VEVLLKRSSLWFEKEELPKAFADFDTAIALDPKQPDIYCHRGQLHMLQQDLQKAVDDLNKSVKLDGGSVLARIQLGMAHHRLKQTTDAKAVFQEAEARFPNSPDALNSHGEFLIDTGNLESAKAKFEKAIEVSNGGFALAQVNLGVIKLHAEQDSEAAIKLCKKAIAADPLCETAHIHLAHLCLSVPDLAGALAAFDDAVALIRVKQELEETFQMREAAAAQLALVTEQPEIYKPVLEKQHRDMKERVAQYQATGQM